MAVLVPKFFNSAPPRPAPPHPGKRCRCPAPKIAPGQGSGQTFLHHQKFLGVKNFWTVFLAITKGTRRHVTYDNHPNHYIANFRSIVLDDHSSKTIYRLRWLFDPVLSFILRWSCFHKTYSTLVNIFLDQHRILWTAIWGFFYFFYLSKRGYCFCILAP